MKYRNKATGEIVEARTNCQMFTHGAYVEYMIGTPVKKWMCEERFHAQYEPVKEDE